MNDNFRMMMRSTGDTERNSYLGNGKGTDYSYFKVHFCDTFNLLTTATLAKSF